jgi:hypothetical protein
MTLSIAYATGPVKCKLQRQKNHAALNLQEQGQFVCQLSTGAAFMFPHCDCAATSTNCCCRSKKKGRDGVQVEGFWAAAMAGSLGFLPLINFGDQDTAYDAYRIPQRCSLQSKPVSDTHVPGQ